MQHVFAARAARRLLVLFVFGLCVPAFVGCDSSTGTPPEMTDAEIQKRSADEQAARQQAYGKGGVPSGRNPNKAAGKSAAPAPAADPAAEKAAEPEAEKAP
jgi:hypothetical protein